MKSLKNHGNRQNIKCIHDKENTQQTKTRREFYSSCNN